nr:ORF3 [Torque teno Leptonychotes weddellii virus 1]
MTSFRETSTQTECSPRELMRELLDLIDITSQPEWGMSPIHSGPPSLSDSDSLIEADSESSSSSDFYWEDEQNPGGEGPPLVPPQ